MAVIVSHLVSMELCMSLSVIHILVLSGCTHLLQTRMNKGKRIKVGKQSTTTMVKKRETLNLLKKAPNVSMSKDTKQKRGDEERGFPFSCFGAYNLACAAVS